MSDYIPTTVFTYNDIELNAHMLNELFMPSNFLHVFSPFQSIYQLLFCIRILHMSCSLITLILISHKLDGFEKKHYRTLYSKVTKRTDVFVS